MPRVQLFGHGVPLAAPVLAGLDLCDVTRWRFDPPASSAIAGVLEPFLDPFVRSFLFGLEAGAFDGAALVVWRQGAGALHAWRYALELRRLGLLPPGPPLLLWNRAQGSGAAAREFDRGQDRVLGLTLADLPRGAVRDWHGEAVALTALQAAGHLGGAEAMRRRAAARAGQPLDLTPEGPLRPGPRLALAGAPLGGEGVHRWLDTQGALLVDLQAPDAANENPAALLAAHRIEALVWQVDPQDDLHGWRAPGLKRLCADLGIRFVDLGFVPTWPEPADLPERLPCD